MTDPASLAPSELSTARRRRQGAANDEKLLDLSRRVAMLTVSRRDPEAFFAERSEIAHELRRLAMGGRHGQS
ncbi:hypothetical protein LG047_07160 [Methylocystis sp. WRRC1]|uniref:hypothetical protein n=1 Tax=Methylocystis sp. WRRC1 TaxID=1732014 RepID=UPI001D157C5F|nr:hypothetical protein [Methylocystis sp. WRRC1]MCC3245096.1 hypothetical protein [Methylocystis sp. WRRC1]